jgi:hypothetical protein
VFCGDLSKSEEEAQKANIHLFPQFASGMSFVSLAKRDAQKSFLSLMT